MIAIIDYGAGNIGSVAKAFSVLGASIKITSQPADLDKADKIVLPGVGAFRDGMQALQRLKLVQPLVKNIEKGKPYLGLCLGMQLLFEESEEAPGVKGLGILKGKVRRFKFTSGYLKVPHMGWNQIKVKSLRQKRIRLWRKKSKVKTLMCPLLKGIPDNAWMYFVHSYYAAPKDKAIIATATDYGIEFASMVRRDNIYATQFHPEKSQRLGMKMLENFVRL